MEVGRKENLKQLLLHLLALSRWPKGDRSGSWAVTPLGLSFPCVKYEVAAVALVLDLSVICWRNSMTVWRPLENGAPSSRQFWGATFKHKGRQTIRGHGFLIAYFSKDVLTQLKFNYISPSRAVVVQMGFRPTAPSPGSPTKEKSHTVHFMFHILFHSFLLSMAGLWLCWFL